MFTKSIEEKINAVAYYTRNKHLRAPLTNHQLLNAMIALFADSICLGSWSNSQSEWDA